MSFFILFLQKTVNIMPLQIINLTKNSESRPPLTISIFRLTKMKSSACWARTVPENQR